MRLSGLPPEEKARIFKSVIDAYMSGPKLADIAKSLGVGHRTLKRFMTAYNRKEWLIAQEAKQWARVEIGREQSTKFDVSLHNSAGFIMDRIDRERRKSDVTLVTLPMGEGHRKG